MVNVVEVDLLDEDLEVDDDDGGVFESSFEVDVVFLWMP